jgi:hypothetical protein
MSSPEQLVLFIVDVVLVLVGTGLMIYGAVQKASFAGGAASDVPAILKAIADLFDAIGRFIGPSRASKVGFIAIVVGLLLIFLPFFVPAMRG